MVLKKCLAFETIILVVNFNVMHSQNCISQLTSPGTCPPNFELRNGLCYPASNLNLLKCPPAYFLHVDGLCYTNERKSCPADEIKKSEEDITTSTNMPYPLEIKRHTCPEGSIMYKNKCRKIVCTLGEYYRGACHRPLCPPGLVWRGKQCQKPGFVTTVIEIDNTFVNQLNEKPFALEVNEYNEIINHTTTVMPLAIKRPAAFSKMKKNPIFNKKPLLTTTTKSYKAGNSKTNATCCHIISPRICKKYIRWHCFNRKYNICDNRVCSEPVVYLRAPEIKYEPPLLVMPPKPQVGTCNDNTCNTEADCSGCAEGITGKCSPYCYSYICSDKTCAFIHLKDYCSFYPGQNGCTANDGCLWDWCSKPEKQS